MRTYNFLIDSNILFPAEPQSLNDITSLSEIALEFQRLCNKHRHHIFIHPAQIQDITSDRNEERKKLRQLSLKRFEMLMDSPPIVNICKVIPVPSKRNDIVDYYLLAALYAQAVHFLVTEDKEIHKRARLLQIESKVIFLKDAIKMIQSSKRLTIFPHSSIIKAHYLNLEDDIFVSLKEEYPGFMNWISRCREEQRDCIVIQESNQEQYWGIAILKRHDMDFFNKLCNQDILKICTLKLIYKAQGQYMSELLLKGIFDYAYTHDHLCIIVEVNTHSHPDLSNFLEEFGFMKTEHFARNGIDSVYVKYLLPPADSDTNLLSSFEANRLYGPRYIKPNSQRIFLVPIKPEWHNGLFPEFNPQHDFLFESHTYSNSIRKVYISSNTRIKLDEGAALLFYLSHSEQIVTNICIVEKIKISKSTEQIIKFCKGYAVLPESEINHSTRNCTKDAMAIKMRICFSFEPAIKLDELLVLGYIKGPPQTITRLKGDSAAWLLKKINFGS